MAACLQIDPRVCFRILATQNLGRAKTGYGKRCLSVYGFANTGAKLTCLCAQCDVIFVRQCNGQAIGSRDLKAPFRHQLKDLVQSKVRLLIWGLAGGKSRFALSSIRGLGPNVVSQHVLSQGGECQQVLELTTAGEVIKRQV
jgi:hypothetical protein